MPNFIWTAKDKEGKSIVKELSANTIEESEAMLLAEGYTDLELKSDEIGDASREICASNNKGRKSRPEELVRNRGNLQQTTLKLILETIIHDYWLYIMMVLLIVLAIFRGHKNNAIFVGIVTVGWLIFRIWLRSPEIYYAKLNKAKEWHRWRDVLRIAKRCEQIRRMHIIKLPQTELIQARAQSLSGLGRLSEALAEFQQYDNQPGVQSWLYKAKLAGIYGIAKEYDICLEYMRKAIQEKPTPTLYLDYANRLLRYKKDTIKAREALSEVEKSTMIDIAKPYYLLCKGILAYIEGDYSFSKTQLIESLKIAENDRNKPFRDGFISVINSYLCCVLAKQGDLTEARKCFAQAREYLIATEETELLEECKKAVGE
jgi:tetratricopeptide (TPR) repeat protein